MRTLQGALLYYYSMWFACGLRILVVPVATVAASVYRGVCSTSVCMCLLPTVPAVGAAFSEHCGSRALNMVIAETPQLCLRPCCLSVTFYNSAESQI